jgi:hypothetical protein
MFLHSRPWRWLHDRAWLQGTACGWGEGAGKSCKAWGHCMCAAPLLTWVPAACAIRCCSCPLTGSLFGYHRGYQSAASMVYQVHLVPFLLLHGGPMLCALCMCCTRGGTMQRLWLLTTGTSGCPCTCTVFDHTLQPQHSVASMVMMRAGRGCWLLYCTYLLGLPACKWCLSPGGGGPVRTVAACRLLQVLHCCCHGEGVSVTGMPVGCWQHCWWCCRFVSRCWLPTQSQRPVCTLVDIAGLT